MKDYKYDCGSKSLYRFTEKRYDGFGKVISEAEVDCSGSEPTEEQLAAARITYTYDNDDRLLTVTYASAFDSKVSRLEYVYGEYGRLEKIEAVTSGATKMLREYVYDGKGNVISIKDNRTALGGTGYALKTYGYDRLNRATSITVTDSEKTGTAEEYTYAYDKNNHIVKETKVNNYPADTDKVNEVWNYEYDALGRLISTEVYDKGNSEAKSTTAYTYDGAGNRLSETKDEVTVENTYNGLNQMVTSGDSSYNYDSNGNLIKETDSGQDLVKTYSYDADNRLSEAMFAKEGTQTLSQKNTYNGDGQRISKTDNNVTTKYSYQGGSAVYTDGCNENQSLNIMGEAGNIIASERSTGNYFYNKDMRASTTTILDSSGNAKVSYEYTDFGETTAKGDFYNEICYTGGVYDDTTGLYYLNARYYDPDDGRFVTQDTYRGDINDPGSLHLYAYCVNNPVNYVDPSGHWGENVHYRKTCDWAMDLGIGKTDAITLGKADNGVDSGSTSPFRPWSEFAMGWHFNRAKKGNTDSRKVHYNQQFSKAVRKWNNGKGRKKALQELGKGLHALQDIRAHLDYGVGDKLYIHHAWYKDKNKRWVSSTKMFDNINYDIKKGKRDGKGSVAYLGYRGTTRYNNTKRDTVNALKSFKKRVRYRI